MHPRAFWAAIAALPLAAQAAGPQLSIQQVQMDKRTWPSSMRARAWVNVVGSSGSPIQGLGPDVFRVYESGSSSSSKITRVETLESHGTGASIVLVIQASGAMEPVCEELKKSASAFVNGLQERDQVAAVDYAETAETIASQRTQAVLLKVSAAWREIDFGAWEGLTYAEIAECVKRQSGFTPKLAA